MNFGKKKLMKDDPIKLTRFIIFDVFKSRLVRFFFISTLLFYFLVGLLELHFLCYNPSASDFIKFTPCMMGRSFAMVNAATVVLMRDDIAGLFDGFDRWKIDSAGEKVEKRCKRCVRVHYIFICIMSTFGAIYGVLSLLPNPSDYDLYFHLYILQKEFPAISGRLLNFVMKLGFGPLFFSMLILPAFLHHATEHCMFQYYMLKEHIMNLTWDYEDIDDDELLNDEEYQKVVFERLKFCIRRHVTFLKLLEKISERFLSHFFVLNVVFGFLLLLCLGMLANGLYEHTYERTILNICIVGSFNTAVGIAFAGLFHEGQRIKSQTQVIMDEIVKFRWITWNRKNRNILVLIILQSAKLMKLKFTNEVSLDYPFGVRMIRGIISAISLFMSIKNRA